MLIVRAAKACNLIAQSGAKVVRQYVTYITLSFLDIRNVQIVFLSI
jgi:hypothetical protein